MLTEVIVERYDTALAVIKLLDKHTIEDVADILSRVETMFGFDAEEAETEGEDECESADPTYAEVKGYLESVGGGPATKRQILEGLGYEGFHMQVYKKLFKDWVVAGKLIDEGVGKNHTAFFKVGV